MDKNDVLFVLTYIIIRRSAALIIIVTIMLQSGSYDCKLDIPMVLSVHTQAYRARPDDLL